MMMAHVELLSFWHSLQQLQSSEELGVKVEKFASRAFDDLVSAELFALEDSPGNPRVPRACGGLSSGDTTLLGKSGYSAAIKAGDAVNIPAAAPDYHGKLIVPLYTQSLPAGERHRRGSNRSQVSEKGQRGVRRDCLLRWEQWLRRRWRDRSAFELGRRRGSRTRRGGGRRRREPQWQHDTAVIRLQPTRRR